MRCFRMSGCGVLCGAYSRSKVRLPSDGMRGVVVRRGSGNIMQPLVNRFLRNDVDVAKNHEERKIEKEGDEFTCLCVEYK